MPLSLPSHWNSPLRQRLEDLGRALERHPRLAGALLYGDLVRGVHAGPRTPIGLALVLESLGDPADAALAEVLHGAFVADRVEPWVVLESELPRIADVFPIKLFEITRYGHPLCGRLEALEVSSTPEQLRLRAEQLARNLLMRRRTVALMHGGASPERGHAEAASRMRVLLAVLDHLRGGTEEGLLDRSVTTLGLEPAQLKAALEGRPADLDDALGRLVRCIDSLMEDRG